jgi:hypothetical protein
LILDDTLKDRCQRERLVICSFEHMQDDTWPELGATQGKLR